MKHESYKYGLEVCDSDSAKDFVTKIKVCRLYGPRQDCSEPIVNAIDSALKLQQIDLSSAGNAPNEWLYIRDLCTAVDKIINDTKHKSEYIVSSGQVASEYDLVRNVMHITKYEPLEFTEFSDYTASINREMIELDWMPIYSLNSALEHTFVWFSENKDWALPQA